METLFNPEQSGSEPPSGHNTGNLTHPLAAIVGAENCSTALPTLPNSWSNPPIAVVFPASAEEASAVIRAAEETGTALIPFGGGTKLHTGYPPRTDRPYLLLGTARLNRITDYQPDDLTITCEPGVTLSALQETLATRRQCLALDVPLPGRATLGGIVSANASGFLRPAFGTPRDLLIGIHALMTGGTAIKGGGKVVKNVAGYDLCKLFTGSYGTLGILTELTFKVRPLPERERVIAFAAPDLAAAARGGLALHTARLAGTYFLATNELQNGELENGKAHLIVGLQGVEARVEWQTEEFARLAAEAGLEARYETLSPDTVQELLDRQARLESGTHLAGRIACLPTDVAAVAQRLSALPGLSLTAHCASGIINFAFDQTEDTSIVQVHAAVPSGANLLWTRLDAEIQNRESAVVWGESREDAKLQRALKTALDPKSTFSPGRFIGKL